jgi:hypothetical protein
MVLTGDKDQEFDTLILTFWTRSDVVESFVNNWLILLFVNIFMSVLLCTFSSIFDQLILGSILTLVLSNKNNIGSGTLLVYSFEFINIFIMYVAWLLKASIGIRILLSVISILILFIIFTSHYTKSINMQDNPQGYHINLLQLTKSKIKYKDLSLLDRLRLK